MIDFDIQRFENISTSVSNTIITGTNDDDTIFHSDNAQMVTINALGGAMMSLVLMVLNYTPL